METIRNQMMGIISRSFRGVFCEIVNCVAVCLLGQCIALIIDEMS